MPGVSKEQETTVRTSWARVEELGEGGGRRLGQGGNSWRRPRAFTLSEVGAVEDMQHRRDGT